MNTTRFKRWVLPGLAYKAVVIGGGYATGRELAEYFLPSGPWGGLLGMTLAALIWSIVCTATFLFARFSGSFEYGAFFKSLLGPFSILFEVSYLLFALIVLSVFGAAAGAIGEATFGWAPMVGTMLLISAIAVSTIFGNFGVEGIFKYVSFLLYGVYAIFLIVSIGHSGEEIARAYEVFSIGEGWVLGGITYASYSVVGAAIILPVTRHMVSNRDAVVAGLLCGPLAMLPAAIFLVCMTPYLPEITAEVLPADYMLDRLNMPWFQVFYQVMILAALLECGVGFVHAVNERLSASIKKRGGNEIGMAARLGTSGALLLASLAVASSFGLVALIADGYRILAYIFLAVYVLPILTIGVFRMAQARRALTQRASYN